jgi:glycosyltransferase involved in cell wall biosynthesis
VVVVGQGSAEEGLRRQVLEKRLGRTVSFAGWVSEEDLRSLVAAADVAVVPSIYGASAGLRRRRCARRGRVQRAGLPARGQGYGGFGKRGALADAVTAALSDGRPAAWRPRHGAWCRPAWLPAIADLTNSLYRDALRGEEAADEGPAAPRVRRAACSPGCWSGGPPQTSASATDSINLPTEDIASDLQEGHRP